MEIILEQRFIKREQRNDSTDNVGNVVRPVENRTFRTKCGPLGQNATSTGQVFPVKSWSISYALPNLQTHTETSTHTHTSKHGLRPSNSQLPRRQSIGQGTQSSTAATTSDSFTICPMFLNMYLSLFKRV